MCMDIMAHQVTGNGCLFKSSFRPTSKKTSNFPIIDLCEGIEGSPTESPQKVPIMRNAFPYHYVIMKNHIRAPIGYVIYGRADSQAKIVRNCEFICGALLKHQETLFKSTNFKVIFGQTKTNRKVQSNPKFWIYFVPKSIQTQWQLTEYEYITH